MLGKLLLGNPYIFGGIAAVILALGAWAIWERHDAIAAGAERDAAISARDVFKAQADALAGTHKDDVTQMNTCKSVLADQSDAIAKLQFSLVDQNARSEKSAAESDAENKALSDRVAEQQAYIAGNPTKVCRLAPEMRKRAEQRVWK